MVKMKVPEGGTGCSFEGEEFVADAKGIVEVPAEAVATLQDHGFVVVKQEAKK